MAAIDSTAGVLTAVGFVNGELADTVIGLAATDQRLVDAELISTDGTDNKAGSERTPFSASALPQLRLRLTNSRSRCGVTSAGSNAHVLPVPMMNVLNGGEHADNAVDYQEFMFMPVGAASFTEALVWGVEAYHVLKKVLGDKGLSTGIGDEGGFAPDLASNEEAIQLLVQAIEMSGRTLVTTSPLRWMSPRPSSTTPKPASTPSPPRAAASTQRDGRRARCVVRPISGRVDRRRDG